MLSSSARRAAAHLSVFVASTAVAACASPEVPPTAQMADARTSLTQAESDGARDGAPVELAMARDKLTRADEAMHTEKFDVARSLSEEAQVDAELADRKTRAAKAKAAADELARSNQLLREELDRKAVR
jgi:hypothetical protein